MKQIKVVFAISKPDIVILREKDLSEDEYRELAYKVKLLCDLYSVRLIVNKYYKVARELGTTVQLSINDYESNVRSLNGLSVWVSVHSLKKLLALKSLVPMPYLLVISMKLIARKGFQDVV